MSFAFGSVSGLSYAHGRAGAGERDLVKWTTPSRTCEDWLSYRMELAALKAEVKRLEKQPSHPCEECNACATQAVLLSDLREKKENSDSENFYLRQIFSWVSDREPQLGMLI